VCQEWQCVRLFVVGGDAAVYGYDGAGDVGAGAGGEENRRARQVLRLTDTTKRATRADRRAEARSIVSCIILVSKGPGAIAFTVMWLGANFRESTRVS
jgi:hypothetical protein